MKIDLEPEIEAKLSEEASRRGLTPMQLSTEVLTHHVSKNMSPPKAISSDKDKILDDYIARMKERSPGWETRDPYAVDWQAIKAEGRKY